MSSTSHEAAKAVPGTWAPGEEGGVGGPHRHAFRPEAPPDTALQRPEQELLCHTDPPSGQQCDRVHAVGGEHRAGVPGGGGPEAGVAGGKSVCVGGRGGLNQSSLRGSAPCPWHLPCFSAPALGAEGSCCLWLGLGLTASVHQEACPMACCDKREPCLEREWVAGVLAFQLHVWEKRPQRGQMRLLVVFVCFSIFLFKDGAKLEKHLKGA